MIQDNVQNNGQFNDQNPQFSLCSIFKNEEKNLEKFITDHKDLVDEMILVDTGSTDKSNDIVRSFGLPYHFFKWTRNFSEARNYSLQFPTKPWVMVLDIDEQVLPEDFERLKSIMKKEKKEAYSLVQINFTESFENLNWKSTIDLPEQFRSFATGYVESPLIRVFKNHKGICFNGAIHEIVGESIHTLNISSCKTDIPIYHLGWTGAARTDQEKQEKKATYNELIRNTWEKEKTPKMAYYYLSTLENPEDRIKVAFHLTKQYPSVKEFWEIFASTAVKLKQWTRALSYIDKGLSHHPDYIPLFILKAKCLNATGKPGQALDILEPLRKKDPKQPIYWYETFRSLILLHRQEDAQKMTKELPPHFPKTLADDLLKTIS